MRRLFVFLVGIVVLLAVPAQAGAAGEPPGFHGAKLWHDYLCAGDETCEMGDINGDGFADAVAFVKSTKGAPAPGQPDKGDVFVALSNGYTFRPLGKWHDYFCVDDETCALGDVNGDGRADAVAFTKGLSGDVWVALSTGYGFAPPVLAHDDFCYRDDVCKVADANQDGRADLVAFFRTSHGPTDKGKVQTAISLYGFAERFGDPQFLSPQTRVCVDDETCAVADVNGDGITDLLAFVKSTRPDPDRGDVWVSLGYRQGQASYWRTATRWSDYMCVDTEQCLLADMNGDQRADAIALDKTGGRVWVATANQAGTGFQQAQWWQGSGCTDGTVCFVAEVNGDGERPLSDLVAFRRGTSGDVLVSLNATQAEGGTNKLADEGGTVGKDSSIAVGIDGRPLVAHYDATNGDLKVTRCLNVSCTVVTSTAPVTVGDSGAEPSIKIGPDGLPLIAYIRNPSVFPPEPQHRLVVAACTDMACTAAVTTVHDTAAARVDAVGGIAYGADGLPLIVYETVVSGVRQLKALHCQDLRCVTGTVAALDRVDSFSDPALTAGSDGLGLISYFDAGSGDLKVAHCNNASCSSVTSSVVDQLGDTGRFSSITVGGDGLGLIAYHAANGDAGSDLRVAHCADLTCSSATTRTVASGGFAGWFTSIAAGPTGYGVVSHHNRSSRTLQVATCHNASCGTASNFIVDVGGSAGDKGWDTSVAIGVDGFPVVSSFDAQFLDLRIAHCLNPRCSGF
jgi:hypothetical protein